MKRPLCLMLAAALSAFNACGGSSDPSNPDRPLTLTEAAPTMAKTVASVIAGALEGAASATNVSSALTSLAGPLTPVSVRSVHMQSTFTANCPAGGSVRIERVAISEGRYLMSNSTATFAGCGFNPGRRAATMNGSLTLTGVWCPGESSCTGPLVTVPDTPVGTTGSLDVSDVGAVPFIGSVGLGAYSLDLGCSGCVFQGKPDTPPPPSPNTCPAIISPTSVHAGSSGGTFGIVITVGSLCPWTASSNSGFITITAGASGTGSGTVTVSVAANTGAARSGSLSIAGQSVTVSQDAGVTSFDGAYSGSYSGNLSAQGASSAVSGAVTFVVSNGAISVTAPAAGQGSVNGAGASSFSGGLVAGMCNVTFSGNFASTQSGLTASGSWTCTGGATGSGTWTAAGTRP